MKNLILIVYLLAFFNTAFAQDATVKDLKKSADRTIKKDAADTSNKIWKKGGAFSLTVNQGSLSNWSAGGDNFSFSLNANLGLYAFYKKDKHSWDNSLDLAYGVLSSTSLGKRKANDRIDFLSKYGYALNPKLNLAGLVNFRSQFANGFNYLKNSQDADSAVLVSKSLAPAYLLLSVGLDFKPCKDLSLYFSPTTARWVFVGDDNLKAMYNVPLTKSSRQEFGAFASANYLKTIGKNLNFKSKLDLFSNYKSKPQNIDVYWTNNLTAKITKYVNFSFTIDLIYDDDIKNVNPDKGPAPQILQLMGIGFAYNLKN